MTTEELAECLGVAKQTVNRWIREKGWKTEKFPGVKGGRARLILVDTQVCEFIQNTPAFDIDESAKIKNGRILSPAVYLFTR